MPIIAEFVTSATNPDQFPKDRLPEIAMAGRSNVGKSSLINKILAQSRLAHTSSTPGRTQTLNFFRIWPEGRDGKKGFYLVDMPGYGFAKASLSRRAQWAKFINEYLETRETLKGIVQLVDMRHPPQPLDLQMAEWLREVETPYLVVATKADKIAKTKVPQQLQAMAEQLQLPTEDMIAFSAQTGLGREELWRWILNTALDRK